MLALLLITAAPNIDACAAAVHGEIATATAACDATGVTIDLLDPHVMSGACQDAFNAGRSAGRFGPKLPDVARNGLIRDFDAKLALCRNPAPKKDVPIVKTTNLWD